MIMKMAYADFVRFTFSCVAIDNAPAYSYKSTVLRKLLTALLTCCYSYTE